ncbi:hypothetical protein [Chitinophaga sp. YIM B06452]|uniref:hypothetical protein n=1 Tax=Chitinophaga sp. YIM B06452 TaxID=3082158 RepID=UPI0031FEB1D1
MFSHKAAFIAFATGISILFLGFFIYFGTETFARYFGSKTDALVVMPAFDCDKKGRYGGPKIIVDVNHTAYELYISEADCNSGRYDRGKIVQVRLHPWKNDVVMENSHPELYFGIMFLLLVFSVYFSFFKKDSAASSSGSASSSTP